MENGISIAGFMGQASAALESRNIQLDEEQQQELQNYITEVATREEKGKDEFLSFNELRTIDYSEDKILAERLGLDKQEAMVLRQTLGNARHNAIFKDDQWINGQGAQTPPDQELSNLSEHLPRKGKPGSNPKTNSPPPNLLATRGFVDPNRVPDKGDQVETQETNNEELRNKTIESNKQTGQVLINQANIVQKQNDPRLWKALVPEMEIDQSKLGDPEYLQEKQNEFSQKYQEATAQGQIDLANLDLNKKIDNSLKLGDPSNGNNFETLGDLLNDNSGVDTTQILFGGDVSYSDIKLLGQELIDGFVDNSFDFVDKALPTDKAIRLGNNPQANPGIMTRSEMVIRQGDEEIKIPNENGDKKTLSEIKQSLQNSLPPFVTAMNEGSDNPFGFQAVLTNQAGEDAYLIEEADPNGDRKLQLYKLNSDGQAVALTYEESKEHHPVMHNLAPEIYGTQ
ncbi:MAG: hypothetical protein MK033_08350 [Candidatus Caenarcaniphilales bacterium]|nr:hypothetical protein [Candidatus Caenarcaniphilales bacterium]